MQPCHLQPERRAGGLCAQDVRCLRGIVVPPWRTWQYRRAVRRQNDCQHRNRTRCFCSSDPVALARSSWLHRHPRLVEPRPHCRKHSHFRLRANGRRDACACRPRPPASFRTLVRTRRPALHGAPIAQNRRFQFPLRSVCAWPSKTAVSKAMSTSTAFAGGRLCREYASIENTVTTRYFRSKIEMGCEIFIGIEYRYPKKKSAARTMRIPSMSGG